MRKLNDPRTWSEVKPALTPVWKNGSGARPTAWRTGGSDLSSLVIVPIRLSTARAFIAWTREEPLSPHEAIFAIGANTGTGVLVGVVMMGRPIANALDDGRTVQITDLATDGTPKAGAALLCAARWVALAMGYGRLIDCASGGRAGASVCSAACGQRGRGGTGCAWAGMGRVR